ncbi:MAG: branched-chain amino acid ABC transporter substrate-binding protein [Acidimicrobiia bacterium]|nr:MAG: branched-chain amino acid ABC transporter substrate-binding protein [Acidimicrobiia bacterium]
MTPRWLLVVTLLAVLIAACGGGGAATTTTTTTTPEPTAATSAPTDTTAPAAAVPDNPDNGVTAETIKVGWMGDATGPTASAQSFNLRGLEAFVAYQNEQGGVLGRRLELIAKDDQFSAETAATNFTSLVQDDKVLAIIQMGGSHISSALMPEVEQVGIPVIGPPQTIDVQLENPWVFNNIAHYGDQADAAVLRIADRLGSLDEAKVVVIQLELPSGDEWNAYIKDTLAKQGGTYVDRILINPGSPDFPGAVTRLKELVDSQGVNFVAFHGAPAHGLGVVTEMKTQGLRVPIIGIHGIAGLQIYLEGPADMLDLVEGIHSFLPGNVSSPGTDLIREFVAGTEWEEGAKQINFSHGWLDGMILVQAIERAAESGELSRASLQAALQGPFETMGISCPIDWSDSNHSPCAAPFAWNPDEQGLEPVKPFEEWASAIDGEYGLFEG